MESEIEVVPGQIWVHKIKKDYLIGIARIDENHGIIIATFSRGEWLGDEKEGELFEYWDYCLCNDGYAHPGILQSDFELLAFAVPKFLGKSVEVHENG